MSPETADCPPPLSIPHPLQFWLLALFGFSASLFALFVEFWGRCLQTGLILLCRRPALCWVSEVFQLGSENENTAQEASTSSCLCQFTSGSGCTAGPRSSQDQLHVLPSPSVHWSREPCTQGKGLSSTDCQSPLCPSAPKMVRKEPIFFTEEPGTGKQ